ncbi:MAG: LiaI-LiaF-like domain-containing protein [Kiritimatiellia bacterium]
MTSAKNENLGCGIFLVLVGVSLLAERMGWIPFDAEWLLPVALIAWGLSYVLRALK